MALIDGHKYWIQIDAVHSHPKGTYGAKTKYFDYQRQAVLNVPKNSESVPLLANEIREARRFLQKPNHHLIVPRILAADRVSGVYLEEFIPDFRHFEPGFSFEHLPEGEALMAGLAEWYEGQQGVESTFEITFLDLAARLEAHGKGLENLMAQYQQLKSRCRDETAVNFCQVHGDLSTRNFCMVPHEPRIFLLDWEFSRIGFVGYDLVTLAAQELPPAEQFLSKLSALIAKYNSHAKFSIQLSPREAILLWSMDRVAFQLDRRKHNSFESEILLRDHSRMMGQNISLLEGKVLQ